MVKATDENFEHELFSSEVPVVVYFGGDWCGPCKAIKPHVEKLHEMLGNHVKVLTVDVDECPKSTGEYLHKTGVTTVPTFFFYPAPKQVRKYTAVRTSYISPRQLLDWVKCNLTTDEDSD